MKNRYSKRLLLVLCATFAFAYAFAQNSFTDIRNTSLKVADIFNRKEDTLKKQFESKGFSWPVKYIYIRSFKYDAQMEVWAKNTAKEPYRLFKTYKVCMQSGTMGPKRIEGDYQVPEGIYQINEFNPNSLYHFSLGLNYPNSSDRILSDSLRPGGDIYIHGSCVSVGCIPVTDDEIEELYIIAGAARSSGQEFIPVHVFPVRYNVRRSAEYLNTTLRRMEGIRPFEEQLKKVFDYFNEKKQLPVVLINKKGEYVLN